MRISATIRDMSISWYELRDARHLSGLTQMQLSQRMGVSLRSVQNYERPDAVIPVKAEHAIRRVLGSELTQFRAIVEGGNYDPAVGLGLTEREYRLNPKLTGITNVEMLLELLAREDDISGHETTAIPAPPDIPRIGVGGLSKDDVDGLDAAAGSDDTTPLE